MASSWNRWLARWQDEGRLAGWMAVAFSGLGLLFLIYGVVTDDIFGKLTGPTFIAFGIGFLLLFLRSRRNRSL
jgi:hypothetical protein